MTRLCPRAGAACLSLTVAAPVPHPGTTNLETA